MTWFPSSYRQGRNRPRAVEWTCSTDTRLTVRHCGHPTALRPYYVEFAGQSLLQVLGTFPHLARAQAEAVVWMRKQHQQEAGVDLSSFGQGARA